MKRLHITAEGQTEEMFVNDTLMYHLANYEVFSDVRCVLTSRHGSILYSSFASSKPTLKMSD